MPAQVQVLIAIAEYTGGDSLLLQAGGDLLLQSGGKLWLQTNPMPSDGILDPQGFALKAPAENYVTEP